MRNGRMSNASDSRTPLTATFKVRLNGETISIDTVGEAYRFISNLSAVEWMEFRSLHHRRAQRRWAWQRRRKCDAESAGDRRACARCSHAPGFCRPSREGQAFNKRV